MGRLVAADGSFFAYPRGNSPEQLRQSLATLIDALNRRQQKSSGDLSSAVAGLQASIDLANAAIEAIHADLSDGGLTPQQLYELSLVTAVKTALGSVSAAVEDTIKQSEAAAEALIRAYRDSRANSVAIRVEQTARLSDSEAFAQQISTLSTSLGVTNAAIVTEQTARSNGDAANASAISTVSSNVASNTATISTLQSSIDGVQARWGVVVNVNGQVVGLVQLDGGVTGSEFTVVADKFVIAKPGSPGTVSPVFVLDTVNGVASSLAISADLIADGSVFARHIGAREVTADKISAVNLASISANLGTVTTGRIQNDTNTSFWDLNTGDFQIG